MREIKHLSEFKHGKKYKRINSGNTLIVDVFVKGSVPRARHEGNEWIIHLGVGTFYYHLDDVLSSSVEL